MESGSTSGGVSIQRRMVGVKVTPMMVKIVPVHRPKATAVWVVRATSS